MLAVLDLDLEVEKVQRMEEGVVCSWCTSVRPYSFGVVQLECAGVQCCWCMSAVEAAAGRWRVGAQTETADKRLQLEWYMGDLNWCSCRVLYAALVAVYVLLEQYVVAGCPCSGAAMVYAVGGGRGAHGGLQE